MKSYNVYVDSANWLCEPNLVGYSMIDRYVIENGHKIIENPSEADYIIINSCGFTKDHEEDTINLFNKLYSKKEEKATIIIAGCLLKINKKLIDSLDVTPIDFNEGKKFDEIFFKTKKFELIKPYCDTGRYEDQFLKKNLTDPLKIVQIQLTRLMLPFSKKLKKNYQKITDDVAIKNKILVEIGKGCASNCKYCVIRKSKGNIHSREITDIIEDIKKTYDPAKELFLVADDCSCYGMDNNTKLIDLFSEIKKNFPDLLIDLDNINPCWLEKYPDEYIKLFSENNISYATIPIQSGSNKIIKDMNRIYDIEKTISIIKKIKKAAPQTALNTHLIICYPNENFIDFLKSLYASLFFDFTIVFVYSAPNESSSSDFSHFKSRFARNYRLTFFVLFQNFVTFYKLIKLPIKKKK